jgi:hypothetical protein
MSALELSIKGLKDSIKELKNTPSNADISSSEYYDDIKELYENIDLYSEIIIVVEIETIETKERSYFFTMTDNFKERFNNFYLSVIVNNRFTNEMKKEILKLLFKDFFRDNNLRLIRIGALNNSYSKINYVKGFKLANITESSATGGKKRVVKQTVKELQAIAVENNIKITKKVEGKTVRLNKKGLIAKLKRYKLI